MVIPLKSKNLDLLMEKVGKSVLPVDCTDGSSRRYPLQFEENLLKLFPLAVKRVLVKAVVDDLNKREQARGQAPVVIITPTHANWIMECVGQGFGLPYSDAPIISSVLTLYKTWLFSNRPPGMVPEEQYFLRKIAQHFSLLFERRTDDNGQLIKETESIEEVRCRLCLQALQEIYLNTVRKFGPTFTPETWDCYLKIVLTITDVILTWDSRKVLDHLATYALRTLIEIWILSKTRDVLLWGALRALCVNHDWIGRTICTIFFSVSNARLATIHQFNQINFSLTNQTIRAMYGEPYGTASLPVTFAIEAKLERVDEVQLELSTEDCYFFWYQFLTLPGNVSNIKAPETFNLAFLGIERIVDTYIAIGIEEMGDLWKEKDSTRPTPPNASVILNIYGNPLFEVCTLDKPGYEKGTAVAIRTLCKIFTDTVNLEPILPRYLASFYVCIAKMLLKPVHNIVSHALLQQGRKLFVKNLRGSNILIPYFIHGIAAAWSSNRVPSVEVGVACANILVTLACLPNVYSTTTFNPLLLGEDIPTKDRLQPVQHYSDIIPHLQTVLLVALRTESEVRTLQSLLWAYSIVVVEICDGAEHRGGKVPGLDQEWIVAVILIILEKIGVWQNRAMMSAFEVLSFLVTNISHHIENTPAMKVVITLTNRIIRHCVSPQNDEETLHFIAGCYKCIADWIDADSRHTLYDSDYDVGILLVKAIQHGIESQNEIHQTAAQYLLHRLIALNDSHSGPFNSSTISEVNFLEVIAIQHGATDLSPIDLWNNYGQYVRWISLNGQIVSIIDRPDLDGNISAPTVDVISRGPTGKHVWSCRMTLFEYHDKRPSGVVPVPPSEVISQPAVFYDNLDTSFEAITFEHEPELYLNVEDIIAREQGCLLMSDYGLDSNIHYQIPQRPGAELWSGDNKSQYTRLFLAHLGLLAPHTYDMVNFLSADHTFHQGIAQLDYLSERETSLASVLYWQKGQKTAEDVFDNLMGSHEFNEFLDSLGWLVTFDKHTGYTADLQYSTILTPYGLPYFSDATHEMLFLVGPLISNGEGPADPVQVEQEPQFDAEGNQIPQEPVYVTPMNKKYQELLRSNVMIVWLEDEYDWNPFLLTSFSGNQPHIFVVIIPLNNGLFRVWTQMDRYSQPSDWLEENCLFSKHTLALFIRRIVKMNHSLCTPSNYPDAYWHTPNYTRRTQHICELLGVVQSNLSLHEYYAYLLSSATPVAHQGPRTPRVKHVRAPRPQAPEQRSSQPSTLKPMVVTNTALKLPNMEQKPPKPTGKNEKIRDKPPKSERSGKKTERSTRTTPSTSNTPEITPRSSDKEKKGLVKKFKTTTSKTPRPDK